MVSTNIILLGVAAVGAGYLFLTKDGKALLDSFMDSIGNLGGGGGGGAEEEWDAKAMGYDDPFAYEAEDPDAFVPGSSRYQEIIRKNRGRAAASALFRKQ